MPIEATQYETFHFGDEGEVVVVIDDFFSSPEKLERQARQAQYVPGGNHYPGQRAPAPPAYLGEQASLLKRILIDEFGMTNGANLVECNYSIVTTQPEELTPIQRLPHFDGTDPGRLAMLHYLCRAEAGGTSFYRHLATGYETITQDRLSHYNDVLTVEYTERGPPPPQYFSGSDAQFECIGQVAAKPNRMIIYRGIRLHSGDIPQQHDLPTDQQNARLTVNTFLSQRTPA